MTELHRRAAGPCLLLLALLAGCSPAPDDSKVDFRVPVFAREVETGAVEDRIVATGSLRAEQAIALRADTAGALAVARDASGRRLAEGDPVQAGQAVAELTGEEVRLAARTEATRQRYDVARREFESDRALYAEGLLSEREFRSRESALADAALEWQQSLLTENRSRLVTPIAGRILRLARNDQGLPLADGQLVTQGQELAQIAPTSRLVADVDLVGPDMARVRRGLPARVRHHAWDERTFSGRVVRLAPTLDPQTRTLRAEVEVDNPDELLRPGMFVEVTLIAERREDVPVVPREALTERGGGSVVFVLKGQKVEQRAVVPGLGDDEIVEIRSGLAPGERIVVKGLETLTDGVNVRVAGS